MYKNIDRIATALEKLVAQGKTLETERLEQFKKASNIIYGNDATVKEEKGLFTKEDISNAAQKYLADVKDGKDIDEATAEYTKAVEDLSKGDVSADTSNRTELEQRIYNESQKVTGGEFQDWFASLSVEEQSAYSSVYGH
jgi:hypothetical protein